MKGCRKESRTTFQHRLTGSENLTEADLPLLLARIDEIWHAEKGTPEYEELDRLGDLVVAVEDRLYPWGEDDADRETA